jgi:hypothetical protein
MRKSRKTSCSAQTAQIAGCSAQIAQKQRIKKSPESAREWRDLVYLIQCTYPNCF